MENKKKEVDMTRDKLVEEEVARLKEICVDCDLPYEADRLREIIIDSLDAKKTISKILNISEENGLRREIPCVNQKFFDIWDQYRREAKEEVADYLDVSSNTVHFNWGNNRLTYGKQEMKISKFLNKFLEKDSEKFASLRSFIIEIYDFYNVKQFSQIFERIKTDDYHIVISTRPTDILTASYNTSFSSCFRPTGEFGNAPMSFALDNFTGIAYITNNDRGYEYKFGRVFIHLHHKKPIFQIGASYGEMFHKENRLGLRQELISLYDKSDKDMRWMVINDTQGLLEVTRFSSPIYKDGGQTIIYDANTIPPSEVSNHQMIVAPSRCVLCGSSSYQQSGWLCEIDEDGQPYCGGY